MSEVAIRLRVEPLAEGGYIATSPDVPGLVAQGRTVVEASEIAKDVARKIVESCLAHGDPVPPALHNLIPTNGAPGAKPIDLFIPLSVR